MTDVPSTPRGPMTNARRLRIFEAHKGLCIICKLKVRPPWTVEHVIPLGLGGEDIDSNCGPAHEDCRRAKDKTDVAAIARAKRRKAKHVGAFRRAGPPMPGSRASKWKKPFNRPAVLR